LLENIHLARTHLYTKKTLRLIRGLVDRGASTPVLLFSKDQEASGIFAELI